MKRIKFKEKNILTSINIRKFLSLVILIFITSCSSHKFNLNIQPDKLSNNSQPFYIIIKKNSMLNYMNYSINDAYKDYLHSSKSSKIFLIYPSKEKQSISVSKSHKNGISIYFLFQKMPSQNNWKIFISPKKQKNKTIFISKSNRLEVL